MAKPDEARLHEILDIIEQARSEGDKDTEAKATAAYKRETSPEATDPSKYYKDVFTEHKPTSFGRTVAGAYDSAATGALNIPANAIGSAAAITAPWLGADGHKAEDAVHRALGVRPMSQAGAEFNQGVGEMLAPVGHALQKVDEVTHLPVSDVLRHAANLLPFAAGKAPVGAMNATEAEVAARGSIPTREALGKAAKESYKTAEDAGVIMTPESISKLQSSVKDIAERTDPVLHPNTTAVLKRLDKHAESWAYEAKDPLTLGKLEDLRRMAGEAQGKSATPGDVRRLNQVQDKIDEYVQSLTGEDTVAGDVPAAQQALGDARNLYSRFAKDQTIEKLVNKAKIIAGDNPGVTNYRAISTAFRRLAANEKRLRTFTPEEQDAIKAIAAGGNVAGSLAALGKLSGGLTANTVAGAVGYMIHDAPGVAAGAVGTKLASYGFGRAAEALQAGDIKKLSELLRRGPENSAPLTRPENVPFTPRPQPPQVPPTLGLIPDSNPQPGVGSAGRPTGGPTDSSLLADRMAGNLSLERPPALLPRPEAMVSGGPTRGARGRFGTAVSPTGTETQLSEFGLTPDVRSAGTKHPAYPTRQRTMNNASGESAASQEAINRVRAEKKSGIHRYKIEEDGSVIPLVGVTAVDARAFPGQVIVKTGPNGLEIVDRGNMPEAHIKGLLARAKRALENNK
jgi:hypothetical protein